MTKEQARAVRAAQLRGEPVTTVDLQTAINVLGTKRSNKMVLPPLREELRSRANLILMFKLGRAIGQ